MPAGKFHLNPETNKVGRCRAEIQGCRFADPNDPNGGHYETVEEMDTYRERKAELEAQEREQGLLAGPAESSNKVSKGDTKKGIVSEASEDTEKTEGPKNEEKPELKKRPQYKALENPYEGTVPVPEGASLKFPSAFDKFTVNERIDYYSDLISNGKIASNKDREAALNAVMGYDKETGKTFTETMKETYASDVSDSFDSLGVAKSGDFFSAIPYRRVSSLASKYSGVGLDKAMVIDFTKEKPVSFRLEDWQKEYKGRDKEALNEAKEIGNELLGDLKDSVERGMTNPVAGIEGIPPENSKLMRNEVINYLIEEHEDYSEDSLDYVQKVYRNYARVNGYTNKGPEKKFIHTGGYRPPSKTVSDGVREAIKLNMRRKEGRYFPATVNTPLGEAVKVSSSDMTGELRLRGPRGSIDIRRLEKGDKTSEDIVSRRIRDNYLLPSDHVRFNPKTGEGEFYQTGLSYISGEGQMVGNPKPKGPTPFKLLARLPKHYTDEDLDRFIVSEIFRHEVYNGKSWKEIKQFIESNKSK